MLLEVGVKYMSFTQNPTKNIERNNQNRLVEILGFTDSFMPRAAIVRYLDNNRRGQLSVNNLIPYK